MSMRQRQRRPRGAGIGIVIGALILWGMAVGAATPSEEPREDFWVSDNFVSAMAPLGDKLLVGGSFRYLGPPTGSGVVLDSATGTLREDFPQVTGTVYASIADGAGGWFIAGDLERVGDVPVGNLVHLRNDATLNPALLPVIDGAVRAIARTGETLYIGGEFGTVNDQSRGRLAAINIATGQLLAWNPGADDTVRALTVVEGDVYAGGDFTTVGAISRGRIAGINGLNGQVLPWDPRVGVAGDRVNAIAASSTTLYIGGSFDRVTRPSPSNPAISLRTDRDNAVAFSTDSNIPLDWNPAPSGEIFSLAVSGNRVYVGGQFGLIGGQPKRELAAVDLVTGAFLDWPVDGVGGGTVMAIAPSVFSVYVGGWFSLVTESRPVNAAHFGALTGTVQPWTGGADGLVNTMSLSGDNLFIGGEFTSAAGSGRNNLAAIDLSSGVDRGLNIGAAEAVIVSSASSDGELAIVSGSPLLSVGGQPRPVVAAIQDSETQPVTPWAPTIGTPTTDRSVFASAVSQSVIYLGGRFPSVNGQSRQNLAAVERTSGVLIPWNPGADGDVYCMLLHEGTLYIGGAFSQAAGLPRATLAALDPNSGAARPWAPSTNGFVFSMAIANGVMYVGGSFTQAGGQPRQNVAAFSLTDGSLLPWNPGAINQVNAIATRQGVVYLGGPFTEVGGQPRLRLAAVTANPNQATVLDWQPAIGRLGFSEFVQSMIIANNALYVGGVFATVNDAPRRGIAVFDFPEGPPPNPYDINGDGFVNAVDVQLVINAALGIAIDPAYTADVNGDGSVNAVDVQQVINAALGLV